MRPLKFIITTACYDPSQPVASEMHVKGLTGELVRRGHEVHIFYSWYANRYKHYDVDGDPPQARRDENGVFLHPFKSPLRLIDPYLGYFVGTSPPVEHAFDRLVHEVKPDVVHHHIVFFFGHTILRKKAAYLSLYTPHDYWLICNHTDLLRRGTTPCDRKACLDCSLRSIGAKRPPQLWRWSPGYRRSLAGIDLILAANQFMKDRLSREIPNPIACLPIFALAPKPVNTAPRANYFLYAGVLARHKGILTLVEAYRHHRDHIKPNLVIAGRGPQRAEIEALILKYSLQDRIQLRGFAQREDLWSLYQQAAAVVIPSIWYENCPAVALEALSVGTPAIGADIGGLSEIVARIDPRLLFKAGDAGQLADRLANFRPGDYPADRVGRIFRDHFSLESFMTSYEELISAYRSDSQAPIAA